MKVARLVVTGLVVGAVAAFVAALLRPRRPGGYDPWQPPAVPPSSAERAPAQPLAAG